LAERTVVGVVGDIMVRGVEQQSEPQVYLSAGQVDDGSIIGYIPKEMVVRGGGDPAALAGTIARIVRGVDAGQPVSNVQPLEGVVADQIASRAVQARLLGLLAALAVLLAGVGIHGLVSFTVSSRTRELGVRMALGAAPRDLLGLVVGQGARLMLAGLVPGVLLAYLAGRTLSALLASVQPGDPATFLSVTAVCAATAAAGCLAPALRALRLDPVAAIRSE
jgi:ABC-type antimicrobial peptide transport system permease subunit